MTAKSNNGICDSDPFFITVATSICGPLPVDMISFTGKKMGENINLNWKTANEHNFSHFEIQKSINAKEFGAIGTQFSNQKGQYYFIDNYPREGINYYRLKMIDFYGRKSPYSGWRFGLLQFPLKPEFPT